LRLSVVVVTWRRPEYVRACLDHLQRQEPQADEVVVVDASTDELTATVAAEFARAVYVRFPGGAGRMTASRNEALLRVTGDVVAFLDDDADVRGGWSAGLRHAFADPAVGAVAGRTCNGIPGEESEGVTEIGRLQRDGRLTGNFAADPGRLVDVDHGIGANMAFRREVLAALGGFRDDFGGIGGVREDTDVFLRVRALGYRAVFAPAAAVDHLGAPHVKGRRFDYRYVFWARRNHALLLARNFGLGSRELRAWLAREVRTAFSASEARLPRRVARLGLGLAAIAAGLAAGLAKGGWRPSDPVRRDRTGAAIRAHLSGGT
jgi:GT2 family glycosyltransferase